MTDQRMPELGANPLEVAFQDYQRMEHELALTKQEHAHKSDMVNDLLRENEFLRRNYDKAVAERDRYQALAVNLATRAVGVREAVERLVAEAVSAKAAPVEDSGLTSEMMSLQRRLEVSIPSANLVAPITVVTSGASLERPITRRTTLAPNEFR